MDDPTLLLGQVIYEQEKCHERCHEGSHSATAFSLKHLVDDAFT